ncbi:MAG: GrpB family protein [Deltaproteobacteria bacterium]|nr:MAG: GrpB family protein [Deltaproteobacteria bacterium]
MNRNSLILPYAESPAAYVQAVYVQYDPRAIGAAADVVAIIEDAAPWAEVEHIGSTAIPGCAGKGIVDLMAMYPTNRLVATRAALDGLGFQRQKVGHIFPEERPMRIGAVEHDGTRYRLHVHVIADTSPEVETLRRFRDVLRTDRALRDAYQARKRAILESGLQERRAYTDAKGEFIRSVIGPH